MTGQVVYGCARRKALRPCCRWTLDPGRLDVTKAEVLTMAANLCAEHYLRSRLSASRIQLLMPSRAPTSTSDLAGR